MDNQPKWAPSGIHYVRKICANHCKSVSKERPRDTDYTDFTDYNVEKIFIYVYFLPTG